MWKKIVAFVQSFVEDLRDLLVVLRGAWFSVLFNIIALLAFVAAPQGKDMLFSIADELGGGRGAWTVISLLAAVLFWSVCSEFTTRMLIYLTDNSGRSLSPEQVAIRKRCQHLAARVALFFPASLLILAYLLVYLESFHAVSAGSHVYSIHQFSIGTVILIVLLLAEIALLWWLYPGGLIEKLSKKYKALSWMMISDQEKDWLSRLYGMLTNVRVNMPKNAGYTGIDLPRNQLLPDGMTIPDSASFYPFASNPEPAGPNVDVWMFGIKVRFYRCLLQQMVILLVLAVVVIISIGFFFSVNWDNAIGAASIICFAFAAWQVVYLLFHFADKASPFPFRFTLFIWMLVCSQINHDHPVRTLPGKGADRPVLAAYFDSVVNRINSNTSGNYYRVGKEDSIPLIFISAEGGALRTGAFAGLMLAHLQARTPQFRDYIFGYSTVSGGTVGSNFFNAQLLNDRKSPNTPWVLRSKEFFSADFLSAVTAKLAFSEIINYFIPWHIESADRAIALEKGFEEGWIRAYTTGPNLLENSFNDIVGSQNPAVFINTTEVETGRQNVWSNVDVRALPLGKERDLYGREDTTSISYSAAINLSDRFPLVSPAGCFFTVGDSSRRHFVDGGYYENRGSETLLQVLHSLPIGAQNKTGKPVKCYVLQFNFGTNKKPQPVKFANEIAEIFGGIYNTRGGRGDIAEDALQHYVKDTLKGEFIKLDLTQTTNELPMNWVLSGKVVNQLDAYVDKLVQLKRYPKRDSVFNDSNRVRLQKLFIYDKNNIRHGK